MKISIAVLAQLALFAPSVLAPAAFAEDTPVTVAPGVVDGEPDINARDYYGHPAWSIVWDRDAEGRALRIGFVEGSKLPYRQHLGQMLKFMHDDGSNDDADLRRHGEGQTESIWGLEVFWMIGSERAVMEPDPTKPETVKGGRLHRNDMRRTCAVFTADPPGRKATLIGAYCRELPPDATVDEAAARQWLQALDLKIKP
jgi:hypothetical protein